MRALAEKGDQQAVLFHTSIAGVEKRLGLIEGRGLGMQQSWGIIVAAIGALLGLAGFFFALTRQGM